ncbi:MAG TPA: asparagine synthase (glutamine-hydrolyzing) [Candidatus Bathyarchaeia archaeon]|nr:asparagine synthase (glutamine-hydrolyzing) [Candidatus Bathyarchaeia archaeon]
MCGIVGVWSDGRPEQVRAAVCDMMAASRHRGPDAEACVDVFYPPSSGTMKSGSDLPGLEPRETPRQAQGGLWGTHNLVLGHTRLSILDLSEGARQPMHDAASGSWLVFNGEIYNFRQLREELEQLGAGLQHGESEGAGSPCEPGFASTGDTEVLLAALVHWGEAALDRLEGMFAFAFWDGRARRLLLARDRMGVKPLYYYSGPRAFAFASEVKALERAKLGPLTLDHEAMDSFLAYGAVQGPNTIYREIRELEPGRLLRLAGPHEVEDREYWSLSRTVSGSGTNHTQSFDEAVGNVRERLRDAVDSHLVSDVPVGVFLSGGVDSSLLALLASERAKSAITLLTVAFAEQEFSELAYAQQIARELPHHHEVVTLSAGQLRELLPEALSAMDQPTVDGINTYVISRVGASLGLKVLLSGVGGDELFGGYTTFVKVPRLLRFGGAMRPVAPIAARVAKKNPIQWRKIADAGRPQNLAEAYLLQRSIRWTPEELRSHGARLQLDIGTLNDFQKLAVLELEVYMRNQLLRDADVFSMANSVELRVPFLDQRLLATALAISPKHHFAGGSGKRITQRILAELTKQGSARRRKMGFTFPWQQWLPTTLKDDIAKTLGDPRLYEPLALDPAYGRKLLAGLGRRERRQSWLEVWSLFVLLNWYVRTGVECAVA